MPRVLVIGLTIYGTGFARVLSSLLEHLNTSYELHCFGLGGPDKFLVGSRHVHLYRGARDVRLSGAAQQLRSIVEVSEASDRVLARAGVVAGATTSSFATVQEQVADRQLHADRGRPHGS